MQVRYAKDRHESFLKNHSSTPLRSRIECGLHSFDEHGRLGSTTIVTGCHLPDGIVVDVEAGHIYWTNMGIPNLNDGSVERADIDGKEPQDSYREGRHPHPEADHSR
jgi:hypothetical protein